MWMCDVGKVITIVVSPEINLGAIWSFFQELVLQTYGYV